MSRKITRVIETLSGMGTILKEEKHIADAHYDLTVSQTFLVPRSGQEIPGLKKVTGTVSVFEGEKNLFGEDHLILHSEDGRIWPFLTARTVGTSGVFEIVVNAAPEN